MERPYQVDISNCIAQPCPLIRGENTTLQLKFYARELLYNKINVVLRIAFFSLAYYIESFSPQAKVTAAGVVINYPLTSQKDGCKFIENGQCPLEEGEYISYTLTMPVLKIFPKVTNVTFRNLWLLKCVVVVVGDSRNCFLFDWSGWKSDQLLFYQRSSRWWFMKSSLIVFLWILSVFWIYCKFVICSQW